MFGMQFRQTMSFPQHDLKVVEKFIETSLCYSNYMVVFIGAMSQNS
jgi:hypothetical protein